MARPSRPSAKVLDRVVVRAPPVTEGPADGRPRGCGIRVDRRPANASSSSTTPSDSERVAYRSTKDAPTAGSRKRLSSKNCGRQPERVGSARENIPPVRRSPAGPTPGASSTPTRKRRLMAHSSFRRSRNAASWACADNRARCPVRDHEPPAAAPGSLNRRWPVVIETGRSVSQLLVGEPPARPGVRPCSPRHLPAQAARTSACWAEGVCGPTRIAVSMPCRRISFVPSRDRSRRAGRPRLVRLAASASSAGRRRQFCIARVGFDAPTLPRDALARSATAGVRAFFAPDPPGQELPYGPSLRPSPSLAPATSPGRPAPFCLLVARRSLDDYRGSRPGCRSRR